MPAKALYATAHWLRFPAITTPDQLSLTEAPRRSLSWKIGSCGPVGPDGYRLPSEVWAAVGLYPDLASAQSALEDKLAYMPYLAQTTESWHQLLLPIRHQGECNHIDREAPGELFDVSPTDPGGTLMVITTAGYVRGPNFDMERVFDFRRNVDSVLGWIRQVEGCLASQTFTPQTLGDDGFTFSVWRDDETMLNSSYRAGSHRTQMDRHKSENLFDRSSFTRFRILNASGQWNGSDPIAT